MNISQFKQENTIDSEIELKDGRSLLTTKNGFVHWEVSKKGTVEQIDEARYNHAKAQRITKRIRNKRL